MRRRIKRKGLKRNLRKKNLSEGGVVLDLGLGVRRRGGMERKTESDWEMREAKRLETVRQRIREGAWVNLVKMR